MPVTICGINPADYPSGSAQHNCAIRGAYNRTTEYLSENPDLKEEFEFLCGMGQFILPDATWPFGFEEWKKIGVEPFVEGDTDFEMAKVIER